MSCAPGRPVRLAVEALVVVALLAPAPAVADWNEGKAALERGDYQTASEHFAQAVEAHPDYAWAHYMLGLALDGLDRRDEAIERLEQAHRLDPASSTFAIGLGSLLVAAGDTDRAGEVLDSVDRATIAVGDRATLALLQTSVALAAEDATAALAAATAAVQLRPQDPVALRALGRAYEAARQWQSAHEAYLRAWRLDPDITATGRDAVRTGLAAAQALAEGHRVAAYAALAPLAVEVAESAPCHGNALAAGEAWLGAKRFEEAATWFENARLSAPEDPMTLYYCGLVLRCRDRGDEARADLEAALEHGADAGLARRVHAELARLAEAELDLDAAIRDHRAAGEAARAEELAALRDQFQEVLAGRRKLADELEELRTMSRQLAELGEADGVRQFEAKIGQYEAEIGRVDANLDQVRVALASSRQSCR